MFPHTNLAGLGIRWGITLDWPDLTAIEQATCCYPWTEADFLAAQRRPRPPSVCFVAEPERLDRVLGHMVLTWHTRYVEIETLAVHPLWQRMGVGTTLVLKVVSRLARMEARQARLIRVRVPEQDLSRLLFYKAMQFWAVRIERGRRDDKGLDRVVMDLRI